MSDLIIPVKVTRDPAWKKLRPFQLVGLLACKLGKDGKIKPMPWTKYLAICICFSIVSLSTSSSGYAYTLINYPSLSLHDISQALMGPYTTSTTDSLALITSVILQVCMAFLLMAENFRLSRILPNHWNYLENHGDIDQTAKDSVSSKTAKWASR